MAKIRETYISTILYKTRRSSKGLQRLIFRIVATIITLFLILTASKGQTFIPGIFIKLFIAFLSLRILVLVIMIFGTREPFTIYSDHVKISHLVPAKPRLSEITGHGIDSKKGLPCLFVKNHKSVSSDNFNDVKELRLPWSLIENSQEEVTAKIDDLIAQKKGVFTEPLNIVGGHVSFKQDNADYSTSLGIYKFIKYAAALVGVLSLIGAAILLYKLKYI